ncbi:MAG: CYTH domain-containing protein [Solirubrobacterales bacterium]|nr:CYTH domain-containing protein [Solirubrobacterales bacterium]
MGLEIERKWLVPALPAEVGAAPSELIEQGYLVLGSDGSEARLRRKSGRPVLTVKSGGGLSRAEHEVTLSEEQFVALWPATEGRRLVKRRHRFGQIDVDVYEDALAGLIVAEVEFSSEADAAAFEVPAWFGQDVTDDRRYKNQQLAGQRTHPGAAPPG